MAHIHFFLQGKGGVGKTTSAFFFIQHLYDSGKKVISFDCDHINFSLSTYSALNVGKVDLKSPDGKRLDTKRIPKIYNIIEKVCREFAIDKLRKSKDEAVPDDIIISPEEMKELTDNLHIVFDVGASTFLPVLTFLDNSAAYALQASGHKLYYHCVIAGDKMLMDCLICLEALIKNLKEEIRLVIWKNEFFGLLGFEPNEKQLDANFQELDPDSPTYVPLEKMDVYKNNENRFFAIITMRKFEDDYIDNYLKGLLRHGLTFSSILKDKDKPSDKSLLEKAFTMKIRDQLYDQLMAINY